MAAPIQSDSLQPVMLHFQKPLIDETGLHAIGSTQPAGVAVGGGVKLTVRAEIAPADGVSAQDKADVDAALKDLGLDSNTSA